jgi:hypothetical protein
MQTWGETVIGAKTVECEGRLIKKSCEVGRDEKEIKGIRLKIEKRRKLALRWVCVKSKSSIF